MNITPEQDPWDRIHDADRDVPASGNLTNPPDDRPPSAATISCIIVGMLVTFGFAGYGLYRIACWVFNLVP